MLAGRMMSASGSSLIKAANWRIKIDYPPDIYECQFRPTVDVNYQPGTGTASASSYVPSGGQGFPALPPSNAFDGNTSTYWRYNNNAPPNWLAYQYVNPIAPKQVYFYRGTANGTGSTSFDVQYSLDGGSTWITLTSFSSITYTNNVFTGTIQ